ncbi:MAG TPA: hypothetical protein VM123_16490 [archaeon]|nr:hypothetical protein [archaeon]
MSNGFQKKSTSFFYRFLITFLIGSACLLFNVRLSLAQEEKQSPETKLSPEERAVLIQYTSPARFSGELKPGAWVKYQITDPETQEKTQEIELRVTGEEDGAYWIVETVTGLKTGTKSATRVLVNPGEQKVLKILLTDENGEQESLPVLEIVQLYTVFGEMVTRFSEQGAMPPFTWRKGEGRQEVEAAGASFTCGYLEPDIDEEEEAELGEALKDKAASSLGLKSLRSLVEKPEDIGDVMSLKDKVESVTSVEGLKGMLETPDLDDLDEILDLIANRPSKTDKQGDSPLFFSENVPRMIPYSVAIRFFMFIDTLKEIQGGLVKAGSLELSSYAMSE